MSIQRMIDVSCDVKDCYEVTEGSEWTAAAARARAKEDGWRRRKGKDICPAHENERFDTLTFD